MENPFARTVIEFHILQSFPVTCLNRDDVGAPKSAVVGGVPRARVSSQCWKRQVRLAMHDMGVKTALRTKRLADLVAARCREIGADEEKAEKCGSTLGAMLAVDTLFFISPAEVDILAEYAREHDFELPEALPKAEITALSKKLKPFKNASEATDIALFGRMAANLPDLNVQAAASFSHAISTHRVSNEVEFFTALDDFNADPGAAHMGTLEFNAATYYRYVSLDLGQLWESLGGDGVSEAVSAFTKALYIAVPAARQTTQSGACPWQYARVLVRKGQRVQASFEKPVRYENGGGYLQPSIEALNEFLQRQEKLSGSLYGKIADYTFGEDLEFSIDSLSDALASHAKDGGAA